MNENIPFIPGLLLVMLVLAIIASPRVWNLAIGGLLIAIVGCALLAIASWLTYS